MEESDAHCDRADELVLLPNSLSKGDSVTILEKSRLLRSERGKDGLTNFQYMSSVTRLQIDEINLVR